MNSDFHTVSHILKSPIKKFERIRGVSFTKKAKLSVKIIFVKVNYVWLLCNFWYSEKNIILTGLNGHLFESISFGRQISFGVSSFLSKLHVRWPSDSN